MIFSGAKNHDDPGIDPKRLVIGETITIGPTRTVRIIDNFLGFVSGVGLVLCAAWIFLFHAGS